MAKDQLCPIMFPNPDYAFPRDCHCERERCAWWSEYTGQCGLITVPLKKPKTLKKEISPVSRAQIAESMAR